MHGSELLGGLQLDDDTLLNEEVDTEPFVESNPLVVEPYGLLANNAQSAELFKQISEAHAVLSDAEKRKKYDMMRRLGAFDPTARRPAPQGADNRGGPGGGGETFDFGDFGSMGLGDIFSSIFGEFMDPRAQRASAARGSDLRYDLELTLEEAFAGSEKTISIQALARCEACNASGSRGQAAPGRCGTCGGAGKVRAQQVFGSGRQTGDRRR